MSIMWQWHATKDFLFTITTHLLSNIFNCLLILPIAMRFTLAEAYFFDSLSSSTWIPRQCWHILFSTGVYELRVMSLLGITKWSLYYVVSIRSSHTNKISHVISALWYKKISKVTWKASVIVKFWNRAKFNFTCTKRQCRLINMNKISYYRS